MDKIKDCVFCKIVKGEIPCIKIWENKEFLAFLDIKPNTKGMTLVVPKKHYDSDIFKMQEKKYLKFLSVAKKIAKLLEKGLNVKRIAMVVEGMEINHAHIKLYPLHGLDKKFKPMIAEEKVYFENYPGFLTTKEGPLKNFKTLKKLLKKSKEN